MLKLLTCLVFLGVAFGDLDEENGLRAYFRSLYPKNIENSPQMPHSVRTMKKSCGRRKLDQREEKDTSALALSQLSQTKNPPYPVNAKMEEYPIISAADIKDCLETKIKNKMNKQLIDSQRPDENQLPTVTVRPLPDALNDETTTSIITTSKSEIQSDSLLLKPEISIARQNPMMKPITPRSNQDACVDETDFYPDIRDSRRSNSLSAPLNALELENVNDLRNNDQLPISNANEEFEDPTNRIGVSVYNKGNAIPGSPRICYACSTLNNPTCTKPSKQTTVKYCSFDRNSCVTKSYEGMDGTILIRDCAKACNDTVLPVGLVPKYKTCSICHTDLCNAAFSINRENIIFVLLIPIATLCRTLLLK